MATDEDIQLSDMLEFYPASSTPGFQTLISGKKEFAELSGDSTERLQPGRGNFFKHQIFAHRFLRAYDDLLILDAAGTGKSCKVLGFTEYVRKQVAIAKIDPLKADEKVAHFKRFVMLFRSSTQKNEFKSQLVCRCSDGSFETSLVKKAKTETSQKSIVTQEIKKAGYVVSTYTTFARKIAQKYPLESDNQRLAEDYADTIFWIDEGHNILLDPDIATTYREKQRIYHSIWRVFHLALRSKRIITTATPMINRPNEFGSLMNIILPLDGELPPNYDYKNATDNDIRVLFPGLPYDHKTATPEQMAPYFKGQFPSTYSFDDATIEDLEPHFRGRIFFTRSADTGAVPVEEGILQDQNYTINNVTYKSQLVLYTTQMSEHQNAGYVNAYNTGRNDELFDAQRQAANFVFPDGYWGNGITEQERLARQEAKKIKAETKELAARVEEDFEDFEAEELPEGGLTSIGQRVDIVTDELETNEAKKSARAFRRYVTVGRDTFKASDELAPWLSNLSYIRTLSSKFSEIVRIVIEEPGNAFVYCEFVDGSGTIVLSLCFEGMGLIRYNESKSMFIGTGADTIKPYCSGGEMDATSRRVRPDIRGHHQDGKYRYAILSRHTSEAKLDSMKEAMNSYENRHGDYIKVLIASRVGRDAINVNNVLQIHLVGSEWNPSLLYQAMSRGLRATSHTDLIKEEQERLRKEGKDPATAKIMVKVYKHAAISPTLPNIQDNIDLQMYSVSEYKERAIKRIMRIAKKCAVDCQINRNRNIRTGDIDGTSVCDYEDCNYNCVDPFPEDIDYSTYDILYTGPIIADVISNIVNIYRQKNVLTLDQIAAMLPQFRKQYIIRGLERLISNKTSIIDRFGYTTYLREDNGSFYLDRNYPTDTLPSYAMSYYTNGIIGVEQDTLSNITFKFESSKNLEIIEKLEMINPDDPQFNEILSSISIEGQAVILEEVILRKLDGEDSPFIDAILNKYHTMIFAFHEPITELNKLYDKSNQQQPKRGRKKNLDIKRRIRKVNPNSIDRIQIALDEDAEIVYLHTIYSQVATRTGYATTSKFNKGEGRTRLLKPSERQGWRDLNEVELNVYNVLIQVEIAKRAEPFEQLQLYGFKNISDGKFYIRDKTTENPKAAKDARFIKKGLECTSWNKPALIDIMWDIGVPEPAGFFKTYDDPDTVINLLFTKNIKKSYEELITWPMEKLVYYLRWLKESGNSTKTTLCYHIENRMREIGMILRE